MQLWEYKVLYFKREKLSEVEDEINKLGNQGWELVSVTEDTEFGSTLYLMRPRKR